MSYTPIPIEREALTIIDVPFPSLEAWESAASAIGSNMFEGYEPTRSGIELIRDYTTGKLAWICLCALRVIKHTPNNYFPHLNIFADYQKYIRNILI